MEYSDFLIKIYFGKVSFKYVFAYEDYNAVTDILKEYMKKDRQEISLTDEEFVKILAEVSKYPQLVYFQINNEIAKLKKNGKYSLIDKIEVIEFNLSNS